MKVLLASPRLNRLATNLEKMLPDDVWLVLPETGLTKELIRLASDVEVIVCVRLSAEVAQNAKKLRLIQKTGAGVDAIPFQVLDDDVFVANTSGANPVPMAEGAVALVLTLAKQIIQKHNGFQRKEMIRTSGIELRGKIAGIIGLGSIGKKVAKFLQAFGMKIYALKRYPDEALKDILGLDFLGGQNDLDILLQKSDFIVVTVPLTPDTHGMIGERELRLMKKTSFIINVARAAIIQEEPLYKALKERWIAGAAIDVWWPPHWWDPRWNQLDIKPRYPIWELPNVIAIPHSIGITDTPSDAGLKIIAENIMRIYHGKPPINQVDKKLQY